MSREEIQNRLRLIQVEILRLAVDAQEAKEISPLPKELREIDAKFQWFVENI